MGARESTNNAGDVTPARTVPREGISSVAQKVVKEPLHCTTTPSKEEKQNFPPPPPPTASPLLPPSDFTLVPAAPPTHTSPSVAKTLNRPCRDDHLIAPLNMDHYRAVRKALLRVRPQWRNIGLALSIPVYKLNEFSGSLEQKMDAMLEVWLNHTFLTPTWEALMDALRDVTVEGGKPVAAEIEENYRGLSVAERPSLAVKRTEKGALDSYGDYLRGRYSTKLPAFFTLQWPPPPTRKVFNLAMIGHQTLQRGLINEERVRLTLKGSVDDIMKWNWRSSIELKNFFKLDNRNRKVILIEGAPGAGKSTLAWHIVQKWESGILFQEFKVVVFVQLRDPHVQAAKSLVDLLPVESEIMRTEVVSEMRSCRGRNVLFVLDGWDEYGPGLQHGSLFQQLICSPGEVNMHFSSLIITSRPIASGELQRYASSRVEIVGFSSAEVKKYFIECIRDSEQELKGEEENGTVQKFQDHLRERPVIEASCYLPLNAAIIVHLFLALNHTLPHTLHEVFQSLVLCCIIRHLTKEAKGGRPRISSLDDLPPDKQEPFNNICTMAYHGVMKNKATFSVSELQLFNLPTELTTLSLIQAMQSFTAFEQTVSYSFLHLSVQELLAAYHISKLPAAEQIQIFKRLFGQPRLAAVFRFYAAFTKLQTEGVRDIVARIVQKQEKPLLVNLLHSLYEAQDLSLCQFVASRLNGELDLHGNTLSPMDCLVVGYFLSCVCSDQIQNDSFKTNMSLKRLSAGNCHISEKGGKAIGDGLMVNRSLQLLDLHDNPISAGVVNIAESFKRNHSLLQINLGRCGISEKGGKAIGNALIVNRSLQVLNLRGNPISVDVVHIAESLKHNHSLLEINLSNCNVTENGGKAIGDALLVNRSLQVLDVHDNPISAGVVNIAESLKCNRSLQEINLARCGISGKEGKAIGDALMVNRSLQVLDLRDNPISAGVVHIAESLKCNHSLLEIRFGGHGLSVDNVNTLCDALMVDRRSLRVLRLPKNSMEVRGGKAIGGPRVANVLSVQGLELDCNLISTAVVQIAESLKRNVSLQEINLGWCGISCQGGKAIGDALMMNRSLQVLELHDNPISAGVLHIAESLKHNCSLQEINLGNCSISEEGGEAIGGALMVNSSLQVLDLRNNPISAGVIHIAKSLKHNHSLLEIDLSYCDITEKEAELLALSLKENNSLQRLILSLNNLSDGAHIADSLRYNNCLKRLDISQCGLGDRAMQLIGSALEVNNSLEELDVTWNGVVTGIGLLALGESLKRNRGLKKLGLPIISDNDWKQFIVCLQENSHLELTSSTREVVRQHSMTSGDRMIYHH